MDFIMHFVQTFIVWIWLSTLLFYEVDICGFVQNGWIVIKLGSDINDLSDPFTFHAAPSSGQILVQSCSLWQNQLQLLPVSNQMFAC